MRLRWQGLVKGARRRDALILTAGILLAVLTLGTRALLPRTAEVKARASDRSGSEAALAEGLNLQRAGNTHFALNSLRQALELARTPAERAAAGLALGELLVERARVDPGRQAVAARQYLQTALAVEKRPAARTRALSALLTVAVLRKDQAEIRAACAELGKVEIADADLPPILLQQLDALLESGDLRLLFGLLKRAGPYRAHGQYGPEFTYREARIGEDMLERRDRFEAWRTDFAGEGESVADLRAGLLRSTLAQLASVAQNGSAATAAAARFHEARVLILAQRPGEARRILEAIVAGGSPVFQREALVLLMDLARQEERGDDLRALVSRHVLSFGWTPAVEGEFLGALDALQAAGQGGAALAFAERHLPAAASTATEPRLLARMGQLARELREYATADGCYARLLALPLANEHHPAALLARGGIRVAEGDLEGARDWLFRYLNSYPYDRKNDGATLFLLDAIATGTTNLEMAAAAIAAAGRVTDPRQAADLLTVAGSVLETMDLPQLAQTYYRKAALARRLRPSGPAARGVEEPGSLARVRLALARCLLASGKPVEADDMLRRLCSDSSPGSLRTEAACLWAELALEHGQWREGARRLALAGVAATGTVASAAATRLRLDRLAAEVGAGLATNRVVEAFLATATEPGAMRPNSPVRQTYRSCLERLAAQGDSAGLKRALETVQGAADPLPADEFRLRAARTCLTRGDFPAAIDWVKEDGDGTAEMIDNVRRSGEAMRRHL